MPNIRAFYMTKGHQDLPKRQLQRRFAKKKVVPPVPAEDDESSKRPVNDDV